MATIHPRKECDTTQSILRFFAEKVWEHGSDRKFFLHCDREGIGAISPASFIAAAHTMGLSLTAPEILEAFSRWDVDGDGVLSYNEFVTKVAESLAVSTAYESSFDINIAGRLVVPASKCDSFNASTPSGCDDDCLAAIRLRLARKYSSRQKAFLSYHKGAERLSIMPLEELQEGLLRDGLDIPLSTLYRIVDRYNPSLKGTRAVPDVPAATGTHTITFDEFQGIFTGATHPVAK